LLPAVLAALRETSLASIVVVEGAHKLEPGTRYRDAVPGTPVRVVSCETWARGPGASLRCGLAALGSDVDRALVVLADGPELDPQAVERVLAAEAPYAAATYDGATRSHPVALARGAWGDIPDEGLRGREPALVDCSDLRPPGDVDFRR